jgi:hypothetical protein
MTFQSVSEVTSSSYRSPDIRFRSASSGRFLGGAVLPPRFAGLVVHHQDALGFGRAAHHCRYGAWFGDDRMDCTVVQGVAGSGLFLADEHRIEGQRVEFGVQVHRLVDPMPVFATQDVAGVRPAVVVRAIVVAGPEHMQPDPNRFPGRRTGRACRRCRSARTVPSVAHPREWPTVLAEADTCCRRDGRRSCAPPSRRLRYRRAGVDLTQAAAG